MAIQKPIPFTEVIEALLDESTPFSPLYLNRLSDIAPEDKHSLEEAWPKISLRRREAILEDMEENHLADTLLYFEEVGRIAIEDKEPTVRRRAIQILREYELVDLMPAFIHLAEKDPDAEVRAASAAALGTYVYMGEVEDIAPKKLLQVEECLLHLTTGSDTKLVRRRALEALGFSSRKEIPALIEEAYASPDVEWLISAVFAMGRSANKHWSPQVQKMLDHENPEVRAEAASAAGELEIKAAVPKMIKLLADSDSDVRLASIWALSQVGGTGVRTSLEYMLENSEDDDEAEQLENALENLDFTEDLQDLEFLDIPEDGDGKDDSSDDDSEYDYDDLNSGEDED